MQRTESITRLAVLVNTCDKFEDCWDPFFALWRRFGIGTLDHTIYLNTERKTFDAPDGSVHSLRVCEVNGWTEPKPPTWSWCLEKALDAIPEGFILYLQEDYFLTKSIDETWLSDVLKTMNGNAGIDCIHMTDIGIRRTLSGSDIPGLLQGDPCDWYYVSCQAAIWRKSSLRSLIREHETAWQFERWASKRARWMGFRFYVPDLPNQAPPIDYVKTGVIQGKWSESVIPLFRENDIHVDFSRRGFYDGKYGKKENGWFRWQWRRICYNAKAFAARYIWPPKSLLEVLSMRLGHLPNIIRHEQA